MKKKFSKIVPALISVFATSGSAAPTGQGSGTELAARSFQSNGFTCYFTCPDFGQSRNGVPQQTNPSGNTLCYYGNTSQECVYNTSNGQLLQGDVRNNPQCPNNATGPFCGSPPSNSFKKRSPTSRDDKAVQKRQTSAKEVVKRSKKAQQ